MASAMTLAPTTGATKLTSAIACAVSGASAKRIIRRGAAQPGIEDGQIDRRGRVGGGKPAPQTGRIAQIERSGT